MVRATWFLPWAAAISVGALAGAGFLSVFPVDFWTVYPYELGLSALVGVPMAMHFRGGRMWGRVGLIAAAGVVALLLARSRSGGESVQLLVVVLYFIVVLCPAFVGLPVAALVLALSGEWLALAQGMSVANLPRGGLRVAVLLLLTLAPLALFASGPWRDCADGPGGVRRVCDRPSAATDGYNH
jgi:hypothetical protein